jgi:hypothetical protein
MKRSDFLFLCFIAMLFLPFVISGGLYRFYYAFNDAHGYITSFVKFAVLATAGEMLGLRIRSGQYFEKGFGIVPRAMVWGCLGIAIKAAFVIFGSGVPAMLAYLGLEYPAGRLANNFSGGKLLISFSISLLLNLIFAPVMMTLHRVTDTHIINTGGTLSGFFSRMDVADIMVKINWKMHWGFVLKKTIPLFWIPAHTITFLLPAGFQVLFAALLGILLGVILAFAARAESDL